MIGTSTLSGEKRQRFIRKAIEMFRDNGVAKTTVEEIGESAGLYSTYAYQNFGNSKTKKRVLRAAYNYAWDNVILDEYEKQYDQSSNGMARLTGLVDTVIECCENDDSIAHLLLLESRRSYERADFEKPHGYKNFIEILQKNILETQEVSTDELELASSSITGALEGMLRDRYYVKSKRYRNFPATYNEAGIKMMMRKLIASSLGIPSSVDGLEDGQAEI